MLRDRAATDGVLDTDSGTTNVLGLRWDTAADTLSLASKEVLLPHDTIVTKREILRESSKIYDPLGFITPVSIRAKILMQDIWQLNVDWDDPLDGDIRDRWLGIAQDIQKSTGLMKIPRSYFTFDSREEITQLHVFTDASPKAYGAVAYLRQGDQTNFVMAKTRVAPLKKLSLPKLELMAATVGANLAVFLQDSLTNNFPNLQVFLWSDSQIVLHWLNSNKALPQFVSNRVQEAKRHFPPTSWRYCPTSDNPADLVTRGVTPDQLQSSAVWLHGPTWLCAESNWPMWESSTVLLLQNHDVYPPEESVVKETVIKIPSISDFMDPTRHSTLSKLLRVTSYVLRFVHNLRNPSDRRMGVLTVAELTLAQRKWILDRQHHHYATEIASILSSPTKTQPPLTRQLRLFIDDTGLLRCGGRIHNAPVNDAAKFPILLPKKDHVTTLFIRDFHAHQLHAGVSSTLTALRQRFWVPAGRYHVKRVVNKCVTCKKVSGFPFQAPASPPLTSLRLQESRPFAVTGVDFTGELYVRNSKNESKVYICLFTCAATRAVHLEVVSDLSVGTFLLAVRRFASRQSLPDVMISDNATTYQSAATELKLLFQSPTLKQELCRQGVRWKFIPKRAPWYGGFWERLVGLTKTSLKKVIGRASIDLVTLQTIVTEIEAILNDRPLTYVSSAIDDADPLTPSHLLYGRRITSLPHPDVDDDELTDPTYGNDTELQKNASRVALIIQHFWQRWKQEYLTSLRAFHGATGVNGNTKIKVGDVVQIHSDKKRLRWKLAVVESLIRGNDNCVRAVNLRTANGSTNRPISKLYPLEVSAEVTPDVSVEEPIQNEDHPHQPVQGRSKRAAAARHNIKDWARQLRAPPEDV
jgi:transposase InsO family protein